VRERQERIHICGFPGQSCDRASVGRGIHRQDYLARCVY
jgi:hypothetical protein